MYDCSSLYMYISVCDEIYILYSKHALADDDAERQNRLNRSRIERLDRCGEKTTILILETTDLQPRFL